MKRYVIGLNVNDSSELPQAAENIRKFRDIIGVESEMEIQVAINPLGSTPVNTHAIGFVTDADDYYDEEDE